MLIYIYFLIIITEKVIEFKMCGYPGKDLPLLFIKNRKILSLFTSKRKCIHSSNLKTYNSIFND